MLSDNQLGWIGGDFDDWVDDDDVWRRPPPDDPSSPPSSGKKKRKKRAAVTEEDSKVVKYGPMDGGQVGVDSIELDEAYTVIYECCYRSQGALASSWGSQ